MRQRNIVHGYGNIETFKMLVVRDSPRKNFGVLVRYSAASTGGIVNDNNGQNGTKEGEVGKK